jgi:hypothetical protein
MTPKSKRWRLRAQPRASRKQLGTPSLQHHIRKRALARSLCESPSGPAGVAMRARTNQPRPRAPTMRSVQRRRVARGPLKTL